MKRGLSYKAVLLATAALAGCMGTVEGERAQMGGKAPGSDAGPSAGGGTIPTGPGAPGRPGGGSGPGGGGEPCATDEAFFAAEVWEPILSRDCVACHIAGGVAGTTRLLLATSGDDLIAANFETVKTVAMEELEGTSLLLLKASEAVPHGGGRRVLPESAEYQALADLVHRYRNPGSCEGAAPEPTACERLPGINPGAAPLRRLTAQQFANTVRDLFGASIDPGSSFPRTGTSKGFTNWAEANIVSDSGAEDIIAAAEHVAAQAVQNPNALLGCAPSASGCVSRFFDRMAPRVYRRPLEAAERATLDRVYAAGATPAEGLRLALEVMLQSPQFLYLDASRGAAVAGDARVRRLDGWAIATRLSYFLWDTTPDEALRTAASEGALDTVEGVVAEARRLLADPRASRALANFHRDWLHLGKLAGQRKDATLYPEFNAALVADMQEEIDRLAREVILAGDGRLETLLTTRAAETNASLDRIYGSSSGSANRGDWRSTQLDPTERAGILTRAGFLTAHSYAGSSSPVHRGVFVLEQLFCEILIPPPGVPLELPEAQPGETIRDRLAHHRADPACAGCHDRIDPVGFAFENYDALGYWRTSYRDGLAVDATGELVSPPGTFDGPVALTELVANSPAAQACYATQWFRYAQARGEGAEDRCSVERLSSRFAASGGDIRELLVAVTESDAFLYRLTEEMAR